MTTLGNFPSATSIATTDYIPIEQGGVLKKATPSLLPFVQSGTAPTYGWVTRTVQGKEGDIRSLKDVKCADGLAVQGDGSHDDTTGIQAALDLGGRWYATAGTYLSSALTVSSSTELFGDGIGTIFKIKNTTNDSLFKVTAKSNVSFKNFKISGNSANQNQGNGIFVTGASTDIVCENVLVDDHYDWGFNLAQVTRAKLTGCGATSGKAAASANAVRAGFLFGASTPTSADDVEVTNCYVSSSNAFVDGFMSEYGNNHRIIGCRTAVAYTGFKIKGSNVVVSGNYASGGVQGYQTQAGSHNLIFQGNIAYRCNESGFYFNNSDAVNPMIGLVVDGNMAVECGQAPSSTSYGFAFEPLASCTIDQVAVTNNIAIDNQGVGTQTRGISFGVSGTCSNVTLQDNFCKGNTVNYSFNAALQTSTFISDITTTFTPSLKFGGGNTGLTTSSNLGRFTRVGNRVFFTISITLTAKGSSAGSAVISGLPFTSLNLTSLGTLSVIGSFLTFAGQVGAYVDQNATAVNLVSFASGGVSTALTEAAFANNTSIYLNGSYEVPS